MSIMISDRRSILLLVLDQRDHGLHLSSFSFRHLWEMHLLHKFSIISHLLMIPLLLLLLLFISSLLQLLFIEILIHILILISIRITDSISNLCIPLLSQHSFLLILVSLHLLVYSFMIVYFILSYRSM